MSGANSSAAALVDDLISNWRAANIPVVRGRALADARVPDDVVAQALPAIVAAHLGATTLAIATTEVSPDLPTGESVAFWGESTPEPPEEVAVREATTEALAAYWAARGVVQSRVTARKIVAALLYAGLHVGAIARALDAGCFEAVDIRRPSDVTSAALAPVLDPVAAAEARAEATQSGRREAAREVRSARRAFARAVDTGAYHAAIDAATVRVAEAEARLDWRSTPAARPAGQREHIALVVAPALTAIEVPVAVPGRQREGGRAMDAALPAPVA
ncbi:hypothetical protein [Cellulomonas denverensis]|uniref:Uncharacterized protein n=1 Tax=Cellulomonas denverensis TaxID=264297 RepID=A0A7X6QYL7_9CELL|nr:hypothetical protein [Cellulomonas denverensis]NKY22253.1 hypothetical protein [Cellulomonas denverensis]